MKRITLICFGKLKTPGLSDAVSEFTKRLGRYTDFTTFELKTLPVPDKGDAHRTLIPEKEAERVLELLASPAFKPRGGSTCPLWCLDETGRAFPTREWARLFTTLSEKGAGDLALVIGGSLGLGDLLLKRADQKISLGPQTLSHELARLILVEQLYRALSFAAGHPYHNEG